MSIDLLNFHAHSRLTFRIDKINPENDQIGYLAIRQCPAHSFCSLLVLHQSPDP